jgi:hypothetical protein
MKKPGGRKYRDTVLLRKFLKISSVALVRQIQDLNIIGYDRKKLVLASFSAACR